MTPPPSTRPSIASPASPTEAGARPPDLAGTPDISGIPEGTILFDGVCVLCSASFRFVSARDPIARFRFAALQSEYGRWLAGRLGIDPEAADTFAVVIGGRAHFRSDGAIEVLRRLPRWSWCGALRLVPRPLRDWAYDRIARNRYRVFGRMETCMLPTPELRRHMAPTAVPEGAALR